MLSVVRASSLDYLPLPGRRSADPLAGVAGPEREALSVRVVELAHDPGRNAHLHPHSGELIYVIAGAGTAWTPDRQERVGVGDIVRVPANVPHATLPDPGTPMRLLCVFAHPDLSANLTELDIVPGRPDDTAHE